MQSDWWPLLMQFRLLKGRQVNSDRKLWLYLSTRTFVLVERTLFFLDKALIRD